MQLYFKLDFMPNANNLHPSVENCSPGNHNSLAAKPAIETVWTQALPRYYCSQSKEAMDWPIDLFASLSKGSSPM